MDVKEIKFGQFTNDGEISNNINILYSGQGFENISVLGLSDADTWVLT